MKEFQKLKNDELVYLTSEEQKMYKLLYKKELTKSKIKELEFELGILKVRYKKLGDPSLGKDLGISKQTVFRRREDLLNKINRICLKNK